MSLRHSIFLCTILFALTACDPGSGEGLDGNGRPLDEAGSSVPLAPTLESLQANLFTPNCAVSGCHSGASAQEGLVLDDGQSYANLVSQSSVRQPDKLRVNPGDSASSYIVQKVEGSAGISGERMPLERARLDQSLIDTLKLWIDNGAPVSANTNTIKPPVVSRATPANNSRLSALSASISIVFSKPMNPLTLEDLTLSLLAAGGDAGFDEANESSLIVQPSLSTDGLTLTLDISANAQVGDASIEDSYRLTIKGEGVAVARDLDNQVIDGDNDGVAGGDYRLRFRIADSDLLPEFASLRDDFFVPNCAKSGCHSGSSPTADMSLEGDTLYDTIVDVQSAYAPSLKRIDPFNADDSAIVQALEGTITAIPQMPFDNPGGIPQADIDVLRLWIDNGASQ